MIDERHEELAALYVLDLLEGAETADFEAALARDPELRRYVAELREASAALAHAVPAAEPPADLRGRILASVPPAAKPAPKVVPFPAFIPWALAACLAVAALGGGSLYWSKRAENALLLGQRRLAQLEVESLRNQLEAERIVNRRELADARRQLGEAGTRLAALEQRMKAESDLAHYKISALVSLAGNSPQALAVAVWNPMDQQGMLKVAKMPMPATGKDYQLWLIDPQYSTPVDAGVFQIDPASGEAHVRFTATKKVMAPAKFAITLERKGGMPTPHGPVLMIGD